MTRVLQTEEFRSWLNRLRDAVGAAVVIRRVKRLALGNPGDTRSVGEGVFELRIHFGPGYRVPLVRRGADIVLLLCAGDKSSQQSDIARARKLAGEQGELHELGNFNL